jgi:hypothetical protein
MSFVCDPHTISYYKIDFKNKLYQSKYILCIFSAILVTKKGFFSAVHSVQYPGAKGYMHFIPEV